MFMEYWVDLGINILKNGRKKIHSGHFWGTCTGTPRTCTGTPFQNQTCTGTCQTCTGTCQTCTGTPCSVLSSVRILAITCSFII